MPRLVVHSFCHWPCAGGFGNGAEWAGNTGSEEVGGTTGRCHERIAITTPAKPMMIPMTANRNAQVCDSGFLAACSTAERRLSMLPRVWAFILAWRRFNNSAQYSPSERFTPYARITASSSSSLESSNCFLVCSGRPMDFLHNVKALAQMGRGGTSLAGKTLKLLDAPRTRPPHLLSSSVLLGVAAISELAGRAFTPPSSAAARSTCLPVRPLSASRDAWP